MVTSTPPPGRVISDKLDVGDKVEPSFMLLNSRE